MNRSKMSIIDNSWAILINLVYLYLPSKKIKKLPINNKTHNMRYELILQLND